MSWFDLKNTTETKKEYLAKVKYESIISKSADSFLKIVEGELKENIQYRIITETAFNAISVIKYLDDLYELEEIYIAVYRMNKKAVNYLIKLIDDKNVKLEILLSSFF